MLEFRKDLLKGVMLANMIRLGTYSRYLGIGSLSILIPVSQVHSFISLENYKSRRQYLWINLILKVE